MNATGRMQAVRDRLSGQHLDAFFVTDSTNVAYLTGFDGVFDSEDAFAAVVTETAAYLYTDGRYEVAVRTAAEGSPWTPAIPKENLYINVCRDLANAGVGSLALESQVPYGRFRYISERFDGNVVAVDQWVEELRQIKNAEEIDRIAAAAALTDRAFDYVLGIIAVGVREADIALELECFLRREGSEGVAFPPIVASGPNSALPHAKVSTRAIAEGDFVLLDFGARVDGYCADMSRTLVVGTASPEQRAMHAAVLEAQRAGLSALRPGIPGSSVDAAARAVIEAHGYGERIAHGLGHGVGLEVHELPRLDPRASKSVHTDSVVTVEPGIYVPGLGGVRIEDLVVVEGDGARVLSTSSRDLIEL